MSGLQVGGPRTVNDEDGLSVVICDERRELYITSSPEF